MLEESAHAGVPYRKTIRSKVGDIGQQLYANFKLNTNSCGGVIMGGGALTGATVWL